MKRLLAVAGVVVAVTLVTERWGLRPGEATRPMVGDDTVTEPLLNATRAIDIPAPPEAIHPWFAQMGSGRAGWYSYDRLDNAGRPSATELQPEWVDVSAGDSMGEMAGVGFMVAANRPPDVFVIRLREGSRVRMTMSYLIMRTTAGSRVLVRVRARGEPSWLWGTLLRFVLGPGDWVMLRKQLREVHSRAVGTMRRW